MGFQVIRHSGPHLTGYPSLLTAKTVTCDVYILVRVSGPALRRPLCKGNWLRCGKVGGGTAKDRTVNGAQCPPVRVVKGDVIGTGESM
jgi:hypothetical protein